MYSQNSAVPNPKPMDRRSFLLAGGGLALSQLLLGCGGSNQIKLNVKLLKGSIPNQVVSQFRRSLKQQVQLNFSPVDQIQDLFKQLQSWQNPSNTTDDSFWGRFIPFRSSEPPLPSDLVSLGDYWLKAAIGKKLIQPLEQAEIKELKHWWGLDDRWKQLVRRNNQGNLDTQGDVWAAPYRWGSTVIVYDREKFQGLGWTPQDWSDLWRDGLQNRISLLDQSREVIGLVLKKLGKSYNTENLKTIPDLENELRALNQQVKLYSSHQYLEPLIIGDTWLAVGWSSDIIPILARYPQLAAVIPKSGTAIWADLWVRPKGVKTDTLSSQWIDFCWRTDTAKQISVLTKSNSPVFPNISVSDVEKPFRPLLQNNHQVFDKSEFLQWLPASAIDQYESLFAKIKQGV